MKDDAQADLKRASVLFAQTFPDAICQLWDNDAKIRCGVNRGETLEVKFSRQGLSDEHIMMHVDRLAGLINAARS